MTQLQEGDLAPTFTAPVSGGGALSLEDLRGKSVVLYFYPKDDTPGCTKEARAFRDSTPDFEAKDAVVVGVSGDSVNSHDKFANKYGLPFTLVSDPDHAIAQAYGVWKERKLYARVFLGIERSTFLISPEGRIERIWRNVKVDNHVPQVLDTIKSGG